MKAYLVLYNLLSAGGWAYVLALAVSCLQKNVEPAEAWAKFGQPLAIVQSAAFMEILHSLFGMVRSPLIVTAMQVSSRLLLVWGVTYWVDICQAHWSLYLMVISWGLVEVPRYLFYASSLTMSSVPYPLFFLRYSLFMVLYPTGISGEYLQMFTSLSYWSSAIPMWHRMLIVIMLLYIPASPFMILSMAANRKSANKKRAQASNPRPLDGLVWPITNKKTNDRSTSKTNKAIWVAAMEGVDPKVAAKAKKEKNWRYGYVKHVEANVRTSLSSPENALSIASAGLKSAHGMFEFVRNGKSMPFDEAMKTITGSFKSKTIRGAGTTNLKKNPTLKVPYAGQCGKPYYLYKKDRANTIEGVELKAQLKKWVDYGVIEADCADAITNCVDNPGWLDLSQHYFVLLGASSAMGPIHVLLELGANVIAIDIDREFVWQKLIKLARSSNGTLIFPVKDSVENAKLDTMDDGELAKVSGANLLAQTPEIATWLCAVCPEKKITIGNYTYLDGALHVQLSLACDAIMSKLAAAREHLALAFLCTPTDCHPISKEAHDQAADQAKKAPMWQKFSPLVKPNALPPVTDSSSGEEIYLCDGISAAQGPNYILAKRIQHWRAIVARSNGHTISSNVAPSTATASVVHNAQFAAAYGGMHLFKPMEVMYQETSNAVMGALLIHDIRNEKAWSHASYKLTNPLQVFQHGSFHGGVWRSAYKITSFGEMSAVAYYLKTYGFFLSAGVVALSGVATWVATGQPEAATNIFI
uniref:very-long-chain (3R)-3-hydroxyacyl-CoA dehydratase n=1 Tax=Octactis speculum TaxID=3111310 RepID=A0A7S2AMZ6_9STRA|mmetsp:Transcript_12572/g.16632  ORF Transcript_12572/g.16632 Transcript_12572/m.16632 type:complete len:754 (+) Transcript_12572:28-2289(+)|eukprot:CAMPEP_0185750066 /NCGR_PEP_ID=MMETSP1174-20130828/8791_1 /TAXON_ID=35687 /ORGANISM="Dictyocha speculum, Strain CCMP1381" /LENGTH=753 /DNA_ID=CAMNT_0028426457 /DNA_START=23 /DNA_END=2284 /DNA_ORIENTATION=-